MKKHTYRNSYNSFVKRNTNLFVICLSIVTLLFVGTVRQTYGDITKIVPGSPAGTEDISSLENINHFTGSLNFTLSLFSINARGSSGFEGNLRMQNLLYQESVNQLTFCDDDGTCHYQKYYYFGNKANGYFGASPNRKANYLLTTPSIRVKPNNHFENYPGTSVPWTVRSLSSIELTMPDGTVYDLYDDATKGKPFAGNYYQPFPPASAGFLRGKAFRSTDGSDITFISNNDIRDTVPPYEQSSSQATGYVYFKDGTRLEVINDSVKKIIDANGNMTIFDRGTDNRLSKIVDSIGREIKFEYGWDGINPSTPPSEYENTIKYKGFGGSERVVKIYYKNLEFALRPAMDGYPAATISTVRNLFVNDNSVVDGTWNPSIIAKVEYPDGGSIDFKYNSYGELALVTLPTGGKVAYEYGSGFGTGTGTYWNALEWDVNRRLIERRVYDHSGNLISLNKYDSQTHPGGGTQYKGYSDEESYLPLPNGQTSLISKTRHYFYGNPVRFWNTYTYEKAVYNRWDEGKEYKTETYDSNGTTLLNTTETNWQQKNNSSFSWWTASSSIAEPANNPRITSVKTTLADTSQITQKTFLYDNFNNQTDVFEYDYGNAVVGQFLRRIHTDYLTVNPDNNNEDYTSDNIHIRNLPKQKWVSSDINGANKLSLIQFEYDKYTGDNHDELVDRTNVIGHDSTLYSKTNKKRGNVTAVTAYADAQNESEAITSYFQYDILGNVVTIIDGKGYISTINYTDRFGSPDNEARTNSAPSYLNSQNVTVYPLNGQSAFAFPTSGTNPLGYTAYTQFDYFTGAIANTEDINGVISKTLYNDLLDRPTQTVTAIGTPLERQSNVIYNDANRRVETKSDLNALNDNLIKTESFYDGLGRTIKTHRYESDGTFITTESIPSVMVQDLETSIWRAATKVSNPYRAGETVYWTTSLSDSLGRTIKVITPDNAIVKTEYSGNSVTVTDQALKQRRSITNALGQLTRVDEPTSGGLGTVGSPNQPTYYTYDVLNNLTQVQQIGTNMEQCGAASTCSQTRSFTYDSLSRLKSATNPEHGNTVGGVYVPGTINYVYDNNGNLTKKTDARGIRTVYDYDNLNRVIKSCYTVPNPQSDPANCSQLTTQDTNQNTLPVTYAYDNLTNAKGKLTKVTTGSTSNPFSVTEYTAFDVMGRVTAHKQTTDGQQARTTGYIYNLSGALTEETYPSGRVVKNVLDADGELTTVKSKKNATSAFFDYAQNFTYTAAGAVSSMQLGNGQWESTVFNSRLQPTQIALGKLQNGTDKLKLEFTYSPTLTSTDNNGNVLSQKIIVPAIGQDPSHTLTQTYTYDSLNRLKSATEVKGTTEQQWKQTYKYDRYGNREFNTTGSNTTFPTGCAQVVCNPTPNVANNRLVGYSYDNAGNTTVDAEGKTFTYDAENKQTKVVSGGVTLGEYFYDGDGKRVKKIALDENGQLQTTIFIYDASGKLVAEYSTQVATQVTAQVSYLTSDHLGSPRINTDKYGQVTSRHDYRPFGDEITNRGGYGSDTVRKQFTSYENDNETELNFAQARYQNPNHGRFTSPDVLGGHISDPQTLNKYSYVMNNPVNLIDPSGYCGTTAGSTDGTPCIWLAKNGSYQSVSQKEFGDGSGFSGWSRVENIDSVVLDNPTFNGTYAEVAKYQNYQANGISVQLGSDGMFYGVGGDVSVVEDSFNSLSDFLWQPIVEGEGAAGEQIIGQDYLPDSVELSGGFLGLGGTGKLTRNGDVLGGFNANVADSIANPMQAANAMRGRVLPSASLMFNKTLRFGRIARPDRLNIESGTSFGIGGGYILGGQILYVPSTGDVVIGGGLTTPGVYFGGSYLKPITTVPGNW